MNRKAGEGIWETEGEVYKKLVLIAPDSNKKMRMEVNASDYTMKGILSMKCEDVK